MALEIKVKGNIYIRSDERNFIISIKKTRTNRKTGEKEEYFDDEVFPTTIRDCLRYISDKQIKGCNATTFEELQTEYQKWNKILDKISKQLGEPKVSWMK